MDIDKIYNEDCLEGMKQIPDASIDMILCDLPYGTTANRWDNVIPANALWNEYLRIIKPEAAIVLFSSGRFTQKLIESCEALYRYKWIWVKNKKTNFVNAKNRPLAAYEEICIFSKAVTANGKGQRMKYFPQGLKPYNKIEKRKTSKFGSIAGKRPCQKLSTFKAYTNYPCDVLKFDSPTKFSHPSEKPVPLIEYLIKTYTNEGELILDNCMGSGTTAVACINTNRHFLGFELEKEYFELACKRIANAKAEKEIKFAFC